MTPEPRTGADESTVILLEFPHSTPGAKTRAHGIATTAMRLHHDPSSDPAHSVPSVRIQGQGGEIQVFGPPYKPMLYKLVGKDGKVEERNFEFEGGQHGMAFEGDEAARCWLRGDLESESMTWEESTVIMETMDRVRELGGLKYPEDIETTEYPVDLKTRASGKK